VYLDMICEILVYPFSEICIIEKKKLEMCVLGDKTYISNNRSNFNVALFFVSLNVCSFFDLEIRSDSRLWAIAEVELCAGADRSVLQ
jgi:hypothetical protein